ILPELPAAKDRTRTPKRSSLCLTPAVAPLSAKTNVPPRSNATCSVFTRMCSLTTTLALCCQPGLGGNHQCLHTCLQSWMDHRCEARVVIGRDLADLAVLFGFRVQSSIDAADEPEHRWCPPLGSEGAKVLARRRRLRLLYTVRRKVQTKRVAHSLGRRRIIRDQSITVQRRDLRFLWG